MKSQFGWHVIKVEDKRQKPVPSYEQVSDQIEQYLVRKAQTELVTKLRADAKVEKASAPAASSAAPARPLRLRRPLRPQLGAREELILSRAQD